MANIWLSAVAILASAITTGYAHLLNNKICGTSISPRIVNGLRAAPGELPWVVNIHIKTKQGINRCAGSILTTRHILTAAHCLDDGFEEIIVMYGSVSMNDSAISKVDGIIKHPKYAADELLNDVAVFRVNPPIHFGRFARPICLPDSQLKPRSLVNQRGVVAGFGALKDPAVLQEAGLDLSQVTTRFMMKTNLRILDDKDCYRLYISPETGVSRFRPGFQMCTYEKHTDTCVGDSGGALAVRNGGRYYQVGIVSGGLECAGAHPGVFANIFNYIDFIIQAVDALK